MLIIKRLVYFLKKVTNKSVKKVYVDDFFSYL